MFSKIIDEVTGEKLGPNEIGEICAESPYTMKEYLNNPKVSRTYHCCELISFETESVMSFPMKISGDRWNN